MTDSFVLDFLFCTLRIDLFWVVASLGRSTNKMGIEQKQTPIKTLSFNNKSFEPRHLHNEDR